MLEEEKNKKRKAIGISAGIHAVLLLLFILVLAWKEPNPPIPEYGIELNFGLDDAGTGDIQPQSTQESENPEPVEETVEETSDNTDQPVQETESEQQIEETTEQTTSDSEESVEEVTESDSPDQVDTAKEETSVDESNTQEEQQESATEETTTEEPEETTDQGSVETDETTDAPSDGDKENETGDQGSEQGIVDERALYGKEGASTGASLEMSGWDWEYIPTPKEDFQEFGIIVFDITIDDEGYVTKIVTVKTTVTPKVEKIYKDAVRDVTFSKKSDYKPAPFSTGRITFTLKAN